MFAARLKTPVIVFERVIEVLQLAMNPANAVRQTRKPEAVTVALGDLNSFIQRGQGFGDAAKVSPSQAKSEERKEQEEPIAHFRSELFRFHQHFFSAFVFGLKEVQQTAPPQDRKSTRLNSSHV